MSHSALRKILSLRSASTITFLVLSVLLLLPEMALSQSLWVSLNKSGFRHLNFYHKSAPPGLSITQRRQPLLSTKFKVSRNTVFFAEKRRVKIDYTEGGYRLYEPLYIPLDNYIGYGIEYASKRAWEEDLYKAQLKEETDKEGGLLEYEIPIKFPKMVRSIIGEGGPGLKVNGYRKIAFTGKSEWDSGVQSTAAYKQSKFPTLAMEQESKFTITGTIGDKITVKVEQDSKALSDLENRIHLKYTGYDDEIVKSIEAGNTNLSLPNTQFVGYSESVQGLFGIKAEAQVGNLDITVITSQEKGSTEKTTFNAGAQGSQETIRDYDYLRRTYFSIDQVGELQAGDSISFINLYINSDQQEKARGIAVVAPTEGEQPSQEQNIRGEWKYHNFEILEPNTYTIEREQHYIILNNSLSSSQTLACYMEIKKPDGTIDTIGNEDYNVEGDTTYVLKLIWKPNADSSYSTWENEWRNVYNLRSVKIEPDGFELNIYRGVRGGEDPLTDSSEYKGTPIIQLLGLDKEDNDRNATPDNIVDPFYVDFYHGHLIFPYDFRNPFNATVFEPEDRVPEIYESDNQSAIQEASKYYFLVKTTNRASQFSLGHTNIIEGSEVVRMNGRTLQKGKDYNIMYELGQITFLTDEASDPNANITIDYEFAPFFMPERKSLFGSRLVYNFGEQNWIGTTALYKSEATADQKPRVGREPTRNFVWDTDLSLKFEPELMTRMTDALPFVETEASSQVSIQAEFAQSIPNSNTKGLAYIDDFESSREYFDLSIFRGPWTLSSQPVSLDQDTRRSQMWWYNPYDQVRLTDIWPNREVKESENRTNILEIKYFPDIEDSADSWAGLMRRMPLGLQDQTRTKFIEIWMRNPTGHDIEMHVDLGVISEDINNNTVLDTEDRLKNGFRDGILDDDEDTGLDGVVNSAEDSTNTYISSFYNPNAADKHLDNWNYDNREDYSHINGTEGNREDPDKGRRPDTEDINNSGSIDLNNGYFSFGFNINDDTFIADSSINDGTPTGWKLYRIPLQDSLLYIREGSPKWNLIESARIWFTGADTIVTLQIAQLQLVGNKWQEMGIASSNPSTNPILPSESFGVTVKNSQENSDYYPPPGIVVEKDPTSNLKRKEQSLVMQFEDLLPGHSASAYRVLYSAEDYSNYNQMDMYIYGRDMDDPEDLTFFFRMGTDTVNNFYEYRVNVSEGWAESNRMEIDFTELTALKNYMILNNDGQTTGVDTTDGKYYIRGNPSLTRILWYVVGIEVSDSASGSLSGEVWVNELRVTEPRNNNDWAGRLALSTKFADFIDISASYQRQGADFHNLLQKKGSGSITTSKNLRGSLSFHKFLPPGWGLSIPVSASWSNTLSLPRLKPGSDIILPQELRDTEKSDNTTTTFNVSESMRMKTDSWLVNATLNRLSGSLSTSKNESRTPSVPQSSTGRWNLKSKYDLSMRSKPKVSIFGWTEKIYILKTLSKSDFYLLPTTLTFNGEVNSQKRNSLSISGTRTDVYNRDLSLKSNAAYSPFTAINSSFSFTSLRDIRDGPAFNLSLNPDELKLGTELDYNQRFDSSWRPKLISFLETRFSYTANYHHNSDPKQQRDSTYSIDNGNAVNLETSLTWQKLLGGGKKYGAQKSGGRKFPGQGGKDKEIEEDEEEEEDRGPMPGSPVWLWEKFIGVFRSLDPLRLNFSRSKSLAKSGLLGEPSFGYKFGFYEDPGVETIVVENLGQRDQKSLTDSYTLKSGIAPFKSLSADFSYTRRVSTTRSTTEPTRSNSVTFPDISISLTQLERVGFIKKIASSSSLQSGYSIKKDTKDNPDTGELTRTETKKSFNPLFSWSLNWKNGVRTSLKYDKSNTNSEDLRGSGATNTLKRSGNSSITFSLNYTFKAPKGINLPFLKKFKFDSNLTLGVNVTKSQDKSETAKQGLGFNTDSEKHNLNFNTTASYSFSNQISGGMKIGWTDTNDKKLKKVHHIRELSIWTEIRF